MKHFTCQEGEVCRTGDGEVRRCDVLGFDSILGHFVEVWCVNIAVVIPSETIEGDQQHFLSLFVYRRSEDGQSPEEAETCSPQHGEHRHFTDLNWLYPPAKSLIYKRIHLLASHLRFLKTIYSEQSFTNLSYLLDWTDFISALSCMWPNGVYELILRLGVVFTVNFPCLALEDCH